MNRNIWPTVFAATHLILFVCVAAYTLLSVDGQAPMVWLFFAFLDFPVSLVYTLIPLFQDGARHVNDASMLAWLFYPPFFIHGVLGTLWWYWIVRFSTLWWRNRKFN